jgi:hypothetical protein
LGRIKFLVKERKRRILLIIKDLAIKYGLDGALLMGFGGFGALFVEEWLTLN